MDYALLHQSAVVIDGHCDFLYGAVRHRRKLADDAPANRISLPKLRQGGYTAQWLAVFDQWAELSPAENAPAQMLKAIDAFYAELAEHPHVLSHAVTGAEVEQAKIDGKIACILSLEGAEPLGTDFSRLRVFHRLGLRMIGLTWNYANQVADGAGVTYPNGLTDFGRSLIPELNRLGILIDIAHLAPPGVAEVFQLTERPIIASHANAQAICPHRRNLSDPQLDQLARNDGVIGVTFVPEFISATPAEQTLETLIKHITHIRQRIGARHIALGSDFDGYAGATIGLENAGALPNLTRALADAGFTEAEIRAILGLNFLRVFKQATG
jgi:membrane dipeptidase